MKDADKFLTSYLLMYPVMIYLLVQFIPGITIIAAVTLVTLPAVPIHMKLAMKEKKTVKANNN
jgi:sterol desaturase/sphingolipid hydroxylase (fatty acid hydroxylase superfamily)